jgi:hypothetical protein
MNQSIRYWIFFWWAVLIGSIIIFEGHLAFGCIMLFLLGIFHLFKTSETAGPSVADGFTEIKRWLNIKHPFIGYALAIAIPPYFFSAWAIGLRVTSVFSFLLSLTLYCLCAGIITSALYVSAVAGYSKSKRDLEEKKKYKIPGKYTAANIPAYCIIGIVLSALHVFVYIFVSAFNFLRPPRNAKFKRKEKMETGREKELRDILCKTLQRILPRF